MHFEQVVDQRPVRVVDELNGVGSYPGVGKGLSQHGYQRRVGAYGLLAAPQDAGVARLKTQTEDIHGDVGSGLVDAAHHSQRHAAAAGDQTVWLRSCLNDLTDGVGQFSDPLHLVGSPVQPFAGQQQAVQQGLVHAVGFGFLIVG